MTQEVNNTTKINSQHFEETEWKVLLTSKRLQKAVDEINDDSKPILRGLMSYTRDQLMKVLPKYYNKYKQRKKDTFHLDNPFHEAMLSGYESRKNEYIKILKGEIDYSLEEQFYLQENKVKSKLQEAEMKIEHHKKEFRKAEKRVQKEKKEWEVMFPGLDDIIDKHGFTKKSFDLWQKINL